MLLALTGYETALVVVAGSFIVFALVMALVIPRSRPEFPGKRLILKPPVTKNSDGEEVRTTITWERLSD